MARLDSLAGEVALITGGTRGLGFAIARELAKQGCRIAICARNQAELRTAAADLRNHADDVMAIRCDVGDHEQVAGMIARIRKRFGPVDLLVNNAGVIEVGPVESMRLSDFEDMMRTMFFGIVHTTLEVLPDMKEKGAGRIVNITSIGGKIGAPHLLPYDSAKFAAVGFSEGLHAEVAKDGIVVTTVVPGLMRTGSYRHAIFKGDAAKEFAWFSLASTTPLLTISGERAARQIVRAIRSRSAEVILTLPARAAARLHALMPGRSASLVGLLTRLFLRNSNPSKVKGYEAEKQIHSRAHKAATTLGRRAGRRLHQVR